MCGIYGEVSATGGAGEALPRSLDAMRHRGPDQSGRWSDGVCALGHRRLAVIDLTDAGRQPLSNEEGSVWVTFNGEVYNFAALRRELEGMGHEFRSRTDTEVIVHAYEQWGERCVDRFRGMFAFGIWDRRRRRLFLARDRVGKKPLFYTVSEGRFSFASELQGLLADPRIDATVNEDAVDDYLTLGYVHAPATAFRGISKLPPAHRMTVVLDAAGGLEVRTERYWTLDYRPKSRMTTGEACEALRETLTEAVRLRMVSDVPLGAFLSGGVDSGVVVGLMAGMSDRPVKTFSVGFDDPAYDELDHARRVAREFGTDHHEIVVRPDDVSVLGTLVRHFGEPFADSSAVPTYHVARATRSGVTVALNGDGGDESFAGYDRYRAMLAAERVRSLPFGGRIASLAGRLLPDSVDPNNRLRRARRFLRAAGLPPARLYARWLTYASPAVKESLYTREFRERLSGRDRRSPLESLYRGAEDFGGVDAGLYTDVNSYLPYDLLVKADVTSMAVGLEARSPFLDQEVMSFAAALPQGLKIRGSTTKYLLKRAFADLLPRETTNRPKMGFGVPVGRWFRGPLRGWLEDALLSERARARGYFAPEAVERLVREHADGRADHAFLLWNLFMLELWHREVLEARPSRAGEAVAA